MWPVNIVIPCVTSYYVKKVEVNSPYFMSIHAAQNNIPDGDGALILPLPTPFGVALRGGTVRLFVTYMYHILTDNVYHIVYSQHFLIECIHLFLSSERGKKGKVIYFITAEWLTNK